MSDGFKLTRATNISAVEIRQLSEDDTQRAEARLSLSVACERPKTAHFLRIQTSHVIGPASSSDIGRPATLRASFI
jgi:hypothetical protein